MFMRIPIDESENHFYAELAHALCCISFICTFIDTC